MLFHSVAVVTPALHCLTHRKVLGSSARGATLLMAPPVILIYILKVEKLVEKSEGKTKVQLNILFCKVSCHSLLLLLFCCV